MRPLGKPLLSYSVLAAAFFVPQQLSLGQSVTPAPSLRDAQAVASLQKAIGALGGAIIVGQVTTIVAQGSVSPATGADSDAGTVVWKDQVIPGDREFRYAFTSAKSGITRLFVSGHGTPGGLSNNTVKRFQAHMEEAILPWHVPAIVLRDVLANASYNIALVGQAKVNGQVAIQLHLSLNDDPVHSVVSVQEWFFDPSSGLPLRVEYRLPDAFDYSKYSTAAADYSDYRPTQGLVTPYQIVGYQDGSAQTITLLSSITLNPPLASSEFDLPTGVSP